MPTICTIAMENVGVWCTGWTRPKGLGSVPAWPMVYMTREAELVEARPTPMALLISASTTNHQPIPHSLWPSA